MLVASAADLAFTPAKGCGGGHDYDMDQLDLKYITYQLCMNFMILPQFEPQPFVIGLPVNALTALHRSTSRRPRGRASSLPPPRPGWRCRAHGRARAHASGAARRGLGLEARGAELYLGEPRLCDSRSALHYHAGGGGAGG